MAQTYQQLTRVILQIFAVFRESKGDFFPLDYIKLHNTFYILKERFPKYFDRLMFYSNQPFVTSDELDDIMFDLAVSGTIRWTDEYYYISGKPKKLNILPPEEENEITELFTTGVSQLL